MTRQNSSVCNLFNGIISLFHRSSSAKSAGIWLTTGLAAIAYLLRTLPGFSLFSPLILAIVLGMLVRNTVGMPHICQAGVGFTLKRILRLAIILLGLQLSLVQVMAIGLNGLAIIVLTLISTFGFTCWIGQQLGVRANLTYLIAMGTSICGASAVIATSAATEGPDEDTAYAVAIVTLFGTLSMLLYPILRLCFNLSPEAFGLWCGASIHEVAQALAAAFQVSAASGDLASIAKLSRVLWLAPMVVWVGILTFTTHRSKTELKPVAIAVPWFVVYFLLFILLNSLNLVPTDLKSIVGSINQFLLTTAMAAMGLETKLKHLQTIGLKPLYLGGLSWLFISVVSYQLIQKFY
jgi:uncharacterized integral membrane protein (TIGR00698 family)